MCTCSELSEGHLLLSKAQEEGNTVEPIHQIDWDSGDSLKKVTKHISGPYLACGPATLKSEFNYVELQLGETEAWSLA
jgi:hypothetical protein